MASRAVAVPKTRSRKGGAAIPLDDLDRRLLNLMQGSFPIEARPFAAVAREAQVDEELVLRRLQRLLDERIIREITPIFDTRALGYRSMLVAAKVPADNPHRAAGIINAHPGVSHNYLRNHEFNLWFTIAVEPDSELGLQGTLDALALETGAESIRQLPTLKLFKIRMDLEMEGDTAALTSAAQAVPPAEVDPQPYDDFDVAVIRATQGAWAVVPEPYAAPARELGIPVQRLLEHLRAMRERRLLRRVAAILFHRRAGFSANGMGVWGVPDERIMEVGGRMAAFRGISHCYQRPTYPDWPYSVFTMAHGRSKEECDAILDSIAADTGIEERATLYSSTEFKKIRLLYFTDEFKEWSGRTRERRLARERRRFVTVSLRDTHSAELYGRAIRVLPGGVNSPVRAMRAIGRSHPVFVDHGSGAELVDVDGNRYVDWVCSWGPLIHGHAHPKIVAAVTDAAALGTTFGAPTAGEVALAEEVCRRVEAVEMMRMTSSGTEAAMSAIRLARAATGRERLLKFAGAYHGHVDGLLAEGGSGLATQGIPSSPGVPEAAVATTRIVAWNDLDAVEAAVAAEPFAAILAEPWPANMGLVAPAPEFLAALRRLADESGALLVFDEVITGFRVSPGGAQELAGVTPDLTIMGKVIGGGLPAAAYGGSVELMELVAPAGDVYQAGTLSGNPLAVAAGLATLELLDDAAYARLSTLTAELAAALREAAADRVPVQVASAPGLLTVFFSEAPVTDYAAAAACDLEAHAQWCRALLARGVYAPPSQFEAWFPSLAHGEEHVARTAEAAGAAFAEVAR